MRLARLLPALLAVLLPAALSMAEPPPKLDQLAPIPLHPGANSISRLAPDGRDGLVAYGWHDNGNAHSHHVMMVMLRNAADRTWTVVGTERPGGAAIDDTIADDPHTGEDMVRTTRLARARVDGKAATLLFVATRMVDPEQGIPAASPVTFQLFRLARSPDALGGGDRFALLQSARSSGRFCHADMALNRQYGLALPADYAGPKTADGC